MKRNINVYKKKIQLSKVKDDSQVFSLTGRSNSVLYTLQTQDRKAALITSLTSGLSFYRSPKIFVYVSNCGK